MHKFPLQLNTSQWFLALMLVLGVILRVYASSPTWLHYDENYYLNIAQNYQDRGELTPYMWRLGSTNIISGGGSGYGVILLAKWLILTGNSLFAGRLFNAGLSLVAGLVMYFTARLWWDNEQAGIFAFLYAIASPSAFYSMILKMDAMAILVDTLVLLLFSLAIKKRITWLYGVVGVLAILSLEFHIISALYLIAMAVYLLVSNLRAILSERRIKINPELVFFFGSAVVAGLIYLYVHVLPDPKSYFVVSNNCFECSNFFLVTELKRFLRLIVYRPTEVGLTIFILLAAWSRKNREDIGYLILFGGWLLTEILIGIPPYDHYSNHMWPLLALGFAGLAAFGFNRKKTNRRLWQMCAYFFVVLSLISNVVQFELKSIPYQLAYYPQDTASLAYIRAHFPLNTVVMAKIPAFYPLRNYRNFLSYLDGSVYGMKIRNESDQEFWERIRPEVIYLEPEDVKKDPVLSRYIQAHHLVAIYADLWADPKIVR